MDAEIGGDVTDRQRASGIFAGVRPGAGLAAAMVFAAWLTASKIRPYVPQRHRLPASPSLISSREGWGFFLRRAVQLTIIPGVQKPH